MIGTGAATAIPEVPPALLPPVTTETQWDLVLLNQKRLIGRDLEIFGTGISYRGPVCKVGNYSGVVEFELAWCASRKMDGKSNPWKICDTITFVALRSVVPQIIGDDRLYIILKQKWPAIILRKNNNLLIPLEHDLSDERTIALIEEVAVRQDCRG